MNPADFFKQSYSALRPQYTRMRWMERMFLRLIDDRAPSLVDLPTGAGKTEVVVIWLIALAWYAQNRNSSKPVPRRLVWVVIFQLIPADGDPDANAASCDAELLSAVPPAT